MYMHYFRYRFIIFLTVFHCQGWVDCFEKASLKGMVGGGGIDAANTAEDHVDIMKKAYELGKNL